MPETTSKTLKLHIPAPAFQKCIGSMPQTLSSSASGLTHYIISPDVSDIFTNER